MRSLGKFDLAAIAVGGVLGATVRSAITQAVPVGGWQTEETGTVTGFVPPSPFEPSQSASVVESAAGIPVDTLTANLCGCLLLGALSLLLVRATAGLQRILLAATTGFCGSLTTFSAFAVEIAAILRARPAQFSDERLAFEPISPVVSSVLAYLGLSLLGGALTFWLGRKLASTVAVSAP